MKNKRQKRNGTDLLATIDLLPTGAYKGIALIKYR